MVWVYVVDPSQCGVGVGIREAMENKEEEV
jgi:hypothetical protein